MTQRKWLPLPHSLLNASFLDFRRFEELLNLHKNYWLAFFLFLYGFQGKIDKAEEKSAAKYPSVIAVMQVIFWNEDKFCFLSGCRNSFNCKLKKAYKRANIIITYSPSNIICSSDESTQIKHFKHHTFIGIFHLVQSANTEQKWRHIQSTDWTNVQMFVIVKTNCSPQNSTRFQGIFTSSF